MSILGILATIVGVFLGLANFPQALKIFKTKSAKDISLTSYLIVEFGSLVWVLYGFEIKNLPIVIPNILGFVATTCVLAGYLFYGKPKKEKRNLK
jgi:MtN3 and saliva related transmembrane protein